MKNQGPMLALLPFETAGGTNSEALAAQGLLEDVCAELTRFPALQVISWKSGLSVAGLPDREAGERLGASHVLRGSLRRTGDRLRITASLSECVGGTQLWSEKFETRREDIFDVEDEIVARIAATLSARLEEATLRQARRRPTGSLAAYELTLSGLTLLRRGMAEADEEARGLFRRALELDPQYARAHAGLSLSYFNEWSCQFWESFEENGRRAYHHAHHALDLDDRDPMLHLVIGQVLLYHREFEQASWYFDRAIQLCPNDADTLIRLALYEVFLGRPETAIERAEKAMRLNPYHPNEYYAYAALAHFAKRDFAKALEIGGKVVGIPIVDFPAYVAIALAYLGRLDEARRYFAIYNDEFRKRITFGREPEPGEACRWLLDLNPYRRQEDLDFIVEGFRLLDEAGAKRSHSNGPARPETDRQAGPVLMRHADSWIVEYANRQIVLPDMKGLHDIRRLLERPAEEIHCLDLAERADESYAGDAALDDKARQSLKARIRDLQEELAEAEDMNDTGRAEHARSEMDQLVETLSRALGLGGRSRRLGDLTERARTTVTWRIRHAVRKIEAAHEPLGRHLANSLRTGVFCSYKPEQPVAWRFTTEMRPGEKAETY
ncbi:MAG: hypothetical protein RH982_11805 [Parvibaculum sp.]